MLDKLYNVCQTNKRILLTVIFYAYLNIKRKINNVKKNDFKPSLICDRCTWEGSYGLHFYIIISWRGNVWALKSTLTSSLIVRNVSVHVYPMWCVIYAIICDKVQYVSDLWQIGCFLCFHCYLHKTKLTTTTDCWKCIKQP